MARARSFWTEGKTSAKAEAEAAPFVRGTGRKSVWSCRVREPGQGEAGSYTELGLLANRLGLSRLRTKLGFHSYFPINLERWRN